MSSSFFAGNTEQHCRSTLGSPGILQETVNPKTNSALRLNATQPGPCFEKDITPGVWPLLISTTLWCRAILSSPNSQLFPTEIIWWSKATWQTHGAREIIYFEQVVRPSAATYAHCSIPDKASYVQFQGSKKDRCCAPLSLANVGATFRVLHACTYSSKS